MSEITAVKPGITLEALGINLSPQEASNRWVDQKTILVGAPKCGKSTFLAQGGEKSYFFRLANEFNGLTTWGADLRDLDSIRREIEKLWKVQKAGLWKWDNLVFDPMYRLLDYISDEVCEEGGNAASIYEVGGFGVGQRAYKKKFKAFLREVDELPAHKFFVFHSITKELKEDHDPKKTYQYRCIEMSEKLDFEITKLVNNTLHIVTGYSGTISARTMVTQGTKNIEAGSKAPCLKKVTQIPWGTDDKVNYDKFRALFN